MHVKHVMGLAIAIAVRQPDRQGTRLHELGAKALDLLHLARPPPKRSKRRTRRCHSGSASKHVSA